MITGHQHLIKDFKNLVKNSRLGHAYTFFGEPEVGKFYFAKHLAHLLEEGEFELTNRPLQDALILDDARGIEEMRELKKFLWQKPVISKKRLVVINNAEHLTPQAQNAILKITEEPPEHAVVILIANQLENIISPLLSRAQKIYFGRLSDDEMGKVAQNKKIIAASFGRPGRAVRLAGEGGMKEVEEYVKGFLSARGPAKSGVIKEFVDAQKDKPELLDLFFEELIIRLRKDSLKNHQLLKSVLHRLFLIKSYNVNKRLQMEAI
jgi:DNA polymerase-3 subunit delta'